MFDFSAKGLFEIVANGIKPLGFVFGGLVLVVQLVFLFDELFHFRLQCLVARQLLESLGIKISLGGVENNEVAVMLVTIFLTGFFILAGFQLVNYILGLLLVQHIVTDLFLLLNGCFHRFHLGANITQLLMGGIASGSQCFGRIKAHFLIQHMGSACVLRLCIFAQFS